KKCLFLLLGVLFFGACTGRKSASGDGAGFAGGDPDYGAALATQSAIVKTLALIQSRNDDPLNVKMDPVVEATAEQYKELWDPVRPLTATQRAYLRDLLYSQLPNLIAINSGPDAARIEIVDSPFTVDEDGYSLGVLARSRLGSASGPIQ